MQLHKENRPTYNSFKCMRERCSNPNHNSYKYYGARGIGVCERWSKFSNFLEDMGLKPPLTSLDRIDADKDYSPENCRWADFKTQVYNRNHPSPSWKRYSRTLREIADDSGINYGTIKSRARKGASEEMLTAPVNYKPRKQA